MKNDMKLMSDALDKIYQITEDIMIIDVSKKVQTAIDEIHSIARYKMDVVGKNGFYKNEDEA